MLPIGNIYLRRPSFSLTPLLTYLSLTPGLHGISIAQRTAFRRYSESISPLMNRWGVFPSHQSLGTRYGDLSPETYGGGERLELDPRVIPVVRMGAELYGKKNWLPVEE